MTADTATADVDIEGIRRMMAAYCHRIDDGELAGWSETFEEGATLTIGRQVYEGRPAILAWAECSLAAAVEPTRHMVTNVEIALDGDSATAVSDFMVLSASMAILVAGRYDDRLVASPDGWKFAERRIGFFRPPRS